MLRELELDIIAEARRNLRAASTIEPGHDQPIENSKRWLLFQQDMRDQNANHNTVAEAIEFAQTFDFDHRSPAFGNEKLISYTRQSLLYEYNHFANYIDQFSESPVSLRSTLAIAKDKVTKTERDVSSIMFFHMLYVLSAMTFKPDIKTVCEIGGGYGGPARLWMTNPISSIKNYTIVDLPESLFYAEVFLRASCPNARVVYCHDNHSFENKDSNTFYLVPIHLAGSTAKMQFDLVVNTGSMAELSEDWVQYWSNWLSKQQCSTFYSHNYFGIDVSNLNQSRNRLAPIMPTGWKIAELRMNHPAMVLQGAPGINAAEAIFIRSESPNSIYEIFKLRASERLNLHNFAYYLFNLPDAEEGNVELEINLLWKAVADLRFIPKELLFLAERIMALKEFTKIDQIQKRHVFNLWSKLRNLYDANFPKGRKTE